MAKTVTIAIQGNGKILTDFEGFSGDECYGEAERLNRALRVLGVEPTDPEVQPKVPEAAPAAVTPNKVGGKS